MPSLRLFPQHSKTLFTLQSGWKRRPAQTEDLKYHLLSYTHPVSLFIRTPLAHRMSSLSLLHVFIFVSFQFGTYEVLPRVYSRPCHLPLPLFRGTMLTCVALQTEKPGRLTGSGEPDCPLLSDVSSGPGRGGEGNEIVLLA